MKIQTQASFLKLVKDVLRMQLYWPSYKFWGKLLEDIFAKFEKAFLKFKPQNLKSCNFQSFKKASKSKALAIAETLKLQKKT